jgi:hypothetical protein
MTISIKAENLQIGDVVHLTTGVAGRVEKIIEITDKTITYHFTYTKCDPYPSSIGKKRSNKHRLQTVVEVDRELIST